MLSDENEMPEATNDANEVAVNANKVEPSNSNKKAPIPESSVPSTEAIQFSNPLPHSDLFKKLLIACCDTCQRRASLLPIPICSGPNVALNKSSIEVEESSLIKVGKYFA